MASLGFRERYLEVAEDGSAVTNTTTETSLLPTSRLTTAFPIGHFDRIGRVVAFCFSGRISNRVTGPDTIRLRLYFGSVIVLDSGLIPLNTTAKTNVPWTFEGELVTRAFGGVTSTTLFPKAVRFASEAIIGSAAATAGAPGAYLLPYNAAPAVGSGFDNGASQLVDLKAIHSVANASNSIQLHAGSVDLYT